MAEARRDQVRDDGLHVDSPPHDLLLAAALDELRERNAELQSAYAAREAELEALVAERTTELKEAHATAAREHERLRDLVERLQEGIVSVNERLEVEFANAEARQLLSHASLEPGEPLPDPWPEFSLRELAERMFAPTSEADEATVSLPDATMRVTALPAAGESAILVLADVSERQRRERAEREFVVNAAHELRTPLAAILTAVEVLRTAEDDPALRDKFLGHLERQSARLGRLAEALLVLARAQMGVEEPRREVIELRPLFERVAADLNPAGGVRLEIDCAPGIAAFGHAELLEQAVANLAANAAKHTSHGTISLRCGPASGGVAIEVADTGSGIAPEDVNRVGDRFYRVGDKPGFGLGLAIAEQAATALSGRLEIDSEPRKGTTARLVLPSADLVTRA